MYHLILGRSTEHLDAVLEGREDLLRCRASLVLSEDDLGSQFPAGRKSEFSGNLCVDQGVVMLKVGTKSLRLKGSPDYVSQDSVCVLWEEKRSA